jgi:hypothetical protein
VLASIEACDLDLDMHQWHTCETTHCRAGLATTIAGKAGRELEVVIGTSAAAALIYQRAYGYVPNFHCTDEDALADIVANAAEVKS